MFIRHAASALIACLVSFPVFAAEGAARAGDLEITNAWTREAPPRARVGGGYLTVRNTGTKPDRLVEARATFASRVEIHEMGMANGVMTMAPLPEGLKIPPGGTVELKPGGFHIMFMGLVAPPKAGSSVSVTLVFERAGEVTLDMPVAPVGAKQPVGHGTGH